MGYQYGLSAANTMEKVTLLKPYKNTKYLVLLTNAGSAATIYTVKAGSSSKNDADGFYASMSNATGAFWWKTEGFI